MPAPIRSHVRAALASTLLAAACGAAAQTAADAPPTAGADTRNEQVIQPQVPRRELRIPKIASRDFMIGAFAGTYATDNFGSHAVYGGRLGYHVTEDFFVDGVYAESEVTDTNFRQILPGGIFAAETEKLYYYSLSAGINVLPGEVFFGRNYAFPSTLYLLVGLGGTKFIEERKLTISYGIGARVFFKTWGAVQVEFRDHIYKLDLLGREQSTHNLELTFGATFFF